MKILLLNQVFYPDVAATAQYLSDLAAVLASRGHEVTVVSSRRAYDNSETVFAARETWRGVKIIRIFSTRFGKASKWRRSVDFASFLFFCCVRLLFLPRQDMVMALTTPPLISFLGACRAKIRRERFCYWVMDFNPDEAIAAGWLRKDSFAAKWLERMSRFSLRQADKIIALDRFMRDRIVAKQIAAEKVAVIPPWPLDQQVAFDPAGRESFRAAHGLTGKFVIMYSGNHSPVHPLDTLIQAADQLRGQTEVVFCFIGGGSGFAQVKKCAQTNPQITCLPYQPLDKLSASLSAADAHVVVMGDAMLGLVHPCKIYNILTIGVPVIYIGPEPSHVTEALAGLDKALPSVSVRHGNIKELLNQIQQLRQAGFAQNGRQTAEVKKQDTQSALLAMVALVESTQTHATGGAAR